MSALRATLQNLLYLSAASYHPLSWTKVSSVLRFIVIGLPHLGQYGTSSDGTFMSLCSAAILLTLSSLS